MSTYHIASKSFYPFLPYPYHIILYCIILPRLITPRPPPLQLTPLHYSVIPITPTDYPLTNLGLSKSVSSIIVFAVSAALHELVISIPMGTVSFHAFFGMLAQVPLIFITKGM